MTGSTRSVDLLVLGATVAGLTTAAEAAAAGASVLVLDPNEVTRFGGGLVTVALGPVLRTVEVHRGVAACETLIGEAERAAAWLRETVAGHGLSIAPRTAYSLAVDGHLAFHLRQEARLLRRGGVAVDFTDSQPLAPIVTRPALVLSGQGQVDPRRHCDALESVARNGGVEVVRGAQLGRFTPGRPWRVTYAGGGRDVTVTTPAVVDTIGSAPWGGLTGGSLRDCPVVVAEPKDSSVSGDIHVLVDTPAAVVMTLRGAIVIVGHPVPAIGEYAASVDLVAFARRLGVEVTGVRSRPVEQTADGLPIVGRVPLLDGAWVARGFGLAETTLGTAAGLQLAAVVTGNEGALPWAPLRAPAPMALYRRWNGEHADPMVAVPQVLKRRGLAGR